MTIIPQDIITTHILCNLPAKSVGRFRCVSMEWLSILSGPQFIQAYQKTLGKNRCVIFESNDGSLSSVPYYNHEVSLTQSELDLEFYRIISIGGSVNGFVLASAYRKLHSNYVLLILNPTTKDYVKSPPISRTSFYGLQGFGYYYLSDDYKVIHISGDYVDVYSLRTNTWKRVCHSPYYYYYKRRFGVFVNRCLHWIAKRPSEQPVISALSLVDEKLSELTLPNLYNEVDIVFDSDTMLVALGDKLAICDQVKGDVWLMNEYGIHKSWTKIVVHGYSENPMIRPMVFYDNGKFLFLSSELLSIYDVEKGNFCKSTDISYMNHRTVMDAYVESLLSPKLSKSS